MYSTICAYYNKMLIHGCQLYQKFSRDVYNTTTYKAVTKFVATYVINNMSSILSSYVTLSHHGKSQCINVYTGSGMLTRYTHWYQCVYLIKLYLMRYTQWYQCIYLVKTFHKSLKLFDGKIQHQVAMGFNLKFWIILRAYWSPLIVIKT